LIAAAWLVLAALVPSASAVQRSRVARDSAAVHQLPNRTSPLITNLPTGMPVTTSDDMVRDVNGEYWFKVRLETGVGFIRAQDVYTEREIENLKRAGVSQNTVAAQPIEEDLWSFVLRGVGIGGYRSTTSNSLTFGGDLEASRCITVDERGYGRRMFAAGLATVIGKDLTFIGLSAVYRIFRHTLPEPEARLRVGTETVTGSFTLGLNLGFRYPFAPETKNYVAAYLEGGSLLMISSSGSAVWGAAGIGYHF
jgi:hypothetical protein